MSEMVEFEGVHWSADLFLSGFVGLCGCANHQEDHHEPGLRMLLRRFGDEDFIGRMEGGSVNKPNYELLATLMDISGLVEHGGSWLGSRLTDKGKAALALVEAIESP